MIETHSLTGVARESEASSEQDRGRSIERGWLHDNILLLRVRLTRDESDELRRRANSVGLKSWDLARQWILAQLERSPGGERADGEHDVDTQTLAFDSVEMRLERLERAVSLMSSVLNLEMRGQVRPLARPQVPPALDGGTPRLHDEILAILREVGRPMTSEAIASEITRRGRYQPRSGHAVSAAAVSGRIANPRYRPLFRRNGRLVSPADDV